VDVTRNPLADRLEPEMIVDLRLYPAVESPLNGPLLDRFRCPCSPEKNTNVEGWTCMGLLGERPLELGETRRVGLVFLVPEKAIPILKSAGTFYLWSGGFFGEATVVDSEL